MVACFALTISLTIQQDPALKRWKPNDPARPVPPIVRPGDPPSDAIALFSRKGLAEWRSVKGGPAKWKTSTGWMEVMPGTGDIRTNRGFGDCQLHLEWCTPNPPVGNEQKRGNSGVWLMSMYEIQILDSYRNRTYADGQAAAVYGQYPPLVNAMRPPGDWQTYDIVFHRPRFDKRGRLLTPARITLLHNGVLVQDNVALTGPVKFKERPPYKAHPDRLPLMLQDHNDRVRFRNIWIRNLE